MAGSGEWTGSTAPPDSSRPPSTPVPAPKQNLVAAEFAAPLVAMAEGGKAKTEEAQTEPVTEKEEIVDLETVDEVANSPNSNSSNDPNKTDAMKLELQDKANLFKQLKLKCLKIDYDSKSNILNGKRYENEKIIDYLTNCDGLPASATAIKTAIENLNEYTAKLIWATDKLDGQYKYKASQVSSQNCELQYDIR